MIYKTNTSSLLNNLENINSWLSTYYSSDVHLEKLSTDNYAFFYDVNHVKNYYPILFICPDYISITESKSHPRIIEQSFTDVLDINYSIKNDELVSYLRTLD